MGLLFRRAIRFCLIAATPGTGLRWWRLPAGRAVRRSRLARMAAGRIRSSRARRAEHQRLHARRPTPLRTIFSPPDSGTSSTDSGTRNWREQVSHLDITNPAGLITISVTASRHRGAEHYGRGHRSGHHGAEHQLHHADHLGRREQRHDRRRGHDGRLPTSSLIAWITPWTRW